MTADLLTDDARWRGVLARDRALDGTFVYAVRSTGVFCRPACPSRRPRRDRVEFFPVPAAAEQAGYRACRRCRPLEAARRDPQVALVEQACRLIEGTAERPTLAGLARGLRVSPAHLQRTFTSITGVSPRAYHEALRSGRLREALRAGHGVSRALYSAGYGSPSRVYERRAARIGMTPATYGKGGTGMTMHYTIRDCALGSLMVAGTDRGLCFVALGDSPARLERTLAEEFPGARRFRDDAVLGDVVRQVLEGIRGREPHGELPLDIRATAFQRLVWTELQRIPPGETITYAELARRIGKPTAVRAVANACARNQVAVVIPCHRAVRSDGGLGGYRWGVERKAALLRAEGGRADGLTG
jgi:AraC family transcriptional regulator of adaptative response/methylated-DNA-[protein]-cysteine methyltransferase